MKTGRILFCIILLSAALRLWQLGNVPSGVTHDEMGYIYNAYSIAQTGKNVFGERLPIFTWMSAGGFPFMPVPIYSMAPLFYFLPLTPFVGRLLPALLGVLDVFLLYSIVRMLFSNTPLALLSAFFLAISPWHLHFARSAYDANFALFYYLVAIARFLYETDRKKIPWRSSLAFVAAIYSYRGMSILFLPIIGMLFWYARPTLNRKQIAYLGIGLICCLWLALLPAWKFGRAYTAEGIALFTNPKIQEHVDTSIREAQGPLRLRRFFSNKPTYIIDRFRENYIKSYSPEFLFLYTEPSAIYSIWSRGRLYFVDVVFILLGFGYLFRLRYRAAVVWIGFLLIGGLPGGIGGLPYSSRNFFLSAVFPVLSAAGALFIVSAAKRKRIAFAAISVIGALYLYALGSYLYDYYFRYAFQGAEGWAKSIREISVLAKEKRSTFNTVVLGKTSFGDAVEYAFWNTVKPEVIQQTWKNRKTTPFTHFSIDNVLFSEKCLDQKDLRDPMFRNTTSMYYITVHTCNNEATPSGKIEDYFGNPIWKLFELNRTDPDSYSTL